MKKVLTILFTFSLFAIISATVIAAPKCDTVGGEPVNPGDPACYTSDICKWECVAGATACCYNDRVSGCYFTNNYVGCPTGSYEHGCKMENDCTTGEMCSNYYNIRYFDFEVNTCHYLTVDSWTHCDGIKGLQYATEVTQHTTNGTNCDNLNEATTRSCGVCNETPTQAPYSSREDACKFGSFNSVYLDGVAPNEQLKWLCGTGDTNKRVGDFFTNSTGPIAYGDVVAADSYAPTDKNGDVNCICSPSHEYSCVAGDANCNNKCGQTISVPAVPYITDTACFPNEMKQLTQDEYHEATGDYCVKTRKCPACGAGENNSRGGIWHETN